MQATSGARSRGKIRSTAVIFRSLGDDHGPSYSHSHGTIRYSEYHSALHLAMLGGPVKLQAIWPCTHALTPPESSQEPPHAAELHSGMHHGSW
ncbi:hypothetical protein LTR74_000805 [Friedmanniomyces endolithicus]|nr:hypothetical protein LTR74_000805 [Friedmanniomyces endolithicus]